MRQTAGRRYFSVANPTLPSAAYVQVCLLQSRRRQYAYYFHPSSPPTRCRPPAAYLRPTLLPTRLPHIATHSHPIPTGKGQPISTVPHGRIICARPTPASTRPSSQKIRRPQPPLPDTCNGSGDGTFAADAPARCGFVSSTAPLIPAHPQCQAACSIHSSPLLIRRCQPAAHPHASTKPPKPTPTSTRHHCRLVASRQPASSTSPRRESAAIYHPSSPHVAGDTTIWRRSTTPHGTSGWVRGEGSWATGGPGEGASSQLEWHAVERSQTSTSGIVRPIRRKRCTALAAGCRRTAGSGKMPSDEHTAEARRPSGCHQDDDPGERFTTEEFNEELLRTTATTNSHGSF